MNADDPNIFEVLTNYNDPFFSFMDKSRMGEDN